MCVRRKFLYPIILVIVLLLAVPVCAGAQSKKPKAASKTAPVASTPAGGGDRGLQRRIDFGNSYILGQSIKSGAVYLLHRKKSDIKSMLHYREDYRDEILDNFSVDADSGLGQDMEQEIVTETLSPMTKTHAPTKKTVLK